MPEANVNHCRPKYRIRNNLAAAFIIPMLMASFAHAETSDKTSAPASGEELFNTDIENLLNMDVTSVSKKKQSINSAAAAISLITQEDIRRSGLSTIPDLLRLVPGMDVARVNNNSWAISARGINDQFANKLLVLQDGRTLYTPIFAGTYWSTVDYILEDLDRIEVIRGPGATLWGANAVNGVVNITTKDSKDTQGWMFSTRASNADSDISLRYGGKLNDTTTYRVYGKGRYFDEFGTFSGGDAGDQWVNGRVGFRLDTHGSTKDMFTLQGDIENGRDNTPSSVSSTGAPLRTAITGGTTGNVLARWTHSNSSDSEYSFQMYYDYFQNIPFGAPDFIQHTFDLDFHARMQLDTHNELSWGAGYRVVNSTFRSGPALAFDPAVETTSLFSAFVQNTTTLVPHHWFFTTGSKVEHNDYTGFEFEPTARVLWTPNDKNSIWLAVSRAVRSPSRVETAINIPVATTVIGGFPATVRLLGNEDVKSEDLVAYEIGYRVQPHKNVSIDAAIFLNQYENVTSIETGTPVFGSSVTIPESYANNISGHTFGGEIAMTWQVTEPWRLIGSYSLLHAHFFNVNGSSDSTTAQGLNGSAPVNQAQIRSQYDITPHLSTNAAVYFFDRVEKYSVPSFIRTDVNLIWEPKDGMQFTLGVQNLFDDSHKEYGATGINTVSSETPRTIFISFNYQF